MKAAAAREPTAYGELQPGERVRVAVLVGAEARVLVAVGVRVGVFVLVGEGPTVLVGVRVGVLPGGGVFVSVAVGMGPEARKLKPSTSFASKPQVLPSK